jgi:lipopolysaccharide transport system permease protein
MYAQDNSPQVIIEPRKGFFQINLKAVWQYRELLYFLLWRDIKIRYKQTAIGIGWAVIQPFISMIIFTILFGKLGKIPSDGLPYSIFAFCGLLPWNFFATGVQRAAASVTGDAQLVSKVYFPRLILPIVGTISGVLDLSVSLILLGVMMLWYGITISWAILTLPFFLFLALQTALAVGLWLAALNVRYRDVGHAVPFMIQVWMFCSPVVYPVSMIPTEYRLLYSLNPMVGVLEGFRWALLGKQSPNFEMIFISTLVIWLVFAGGILFFKKMETTFADVI